MARMNLRPEFEAFIKKIASRTAYGGQPVSASIIAKLEIEIRTNGGGVLAPFWLSVLERGRGRRKSTTDSGLWRKMYAWMERRGMFKSKTSAGKINEAKGLTWYINKYGNKQFREGRFVDIYTQARKETIASIEQKYSLEINRITKDIL